LVNFSFYSDSKLYGNSKIKLNWRQASVIALSYRIKRIRIRPWFALDTIGHYYLQFVVCFFKYCVYAILSMFLKLRSTVGVKEKKRYRDLDPHNCRLRTLGAKKTNWSEGSGSGTMLILVIMLPLSYTFLEELQKVSTEFFWLEGTVGQNNF
jgi:hypothetical protein